MENRLNCRFARSALIVGTTWVAVAIVTSTAVRAQWVEPSERPALVPIFVDVAPVLDGGVLGDSAWENAEPAVDFWQTRPDEGQPTTEKTEIYVVFTTDTLYFGVVCYDRTPQDIVVDRKSVV